MTEILVVPSGEEPPTEDVPAAGPQSPLALLRGKREAMDKRLHLDLAVPRWDEFLSITDADGTVHHRRLWVRYGPGNPSVLNARAAERERAHLAAKNKGMAGDSQWEDKARADFLVDACVAVYDLALDEEPPKGELTGDLPTFASPELSEALGAPRNAALTALAVYATPADLLLATTQLLNWSGESSQEADKSFLTN